LFYLNGLTDLLNLNLQTLDPVILTSILSHLKPLLAYHELGYASLKNFWRLLDVYDINIDFYPEHVVEI